MIIWESKQAENATSGTSSRVWQGGKICIDSRICEPGDIFVALPGKNTDGHDFIDDVAKKGASVAIVDRLVETSIPILLVDDVLKALFDMAKFRRSESRAKFIAITGSIGKTSTKEMMMKAFSSMSKTFAGRGNYNNLLGLSINLASMPADLDYAILELGMSEAGEISELTKIVKPDVAVIANIAPAHIENFENIEGIARAKSEIFESMEKGSFALINKDTECSDILLEKAKTQNLNIYLCGENCENFIQNINYDIKDNKSKVSISIKGEKFDYYLSTSMIHLIQNSIFVVVAIYLLCKEQMDKALKGLEEFSPLGGRGKITNIIFNNKNLTLVDDSYNANTISMIAALNNLKKYKHSKRRVAIIGDMLALGEKSIDYHLSLADVIKDSEVDILITVGTMMKHLHDVLPKKIAVLHKDNVDDLIIEIDKYVQNQDIILFKASRAVDLSKLVKYLSEYKDDL